MNAGIFRWLNLLGLAAVLVMNGLANALPLGGRTTGEISAMFPVQITPAPYAFSIWGLIYALLIAYGWVQAFSARRSCQEVLGANPWFLISCFFNIGWLLLWHQLQIAASVFAMLGLLFSLIGCYLGTRPQGNSGDPVIRLLVQLPFSVYLGWISVATIVNITVALSAADWNGFGWSGTVWTLILLAVATVLALLIGSRYHDPAYVLVFVWAFVAIGAANLRLEPIVAYAAWAAALLLLGFALWLLLSNRRARTSAAA